MGWSTQQGHVNLKAEVRVMHTNQGTPRIARKTPEAKGETQERSSPRHPRRNQSCQHLDLRLLASRTVRRYISVGVTLSVVLCYRSPTRYRL